MPHFLSVLALAFVLAFSPVQAFAAADAKAPAGDAELVLATASEEAASSNDDAVESDGDAAHEADEAAHADVEHAEAGGLPQLNVGTYPSQIFWLVLSFAILYTAFSKKVLPGIGSVVESRDAMIKGNLAAAESLRAQAEDVRVSYEKNLEAARANAIKAIQDVELAAKQKATDQAETFRKKTDESIKDAETRVGAQKDKALGDMKQVAAEVASIAAEKITGINMDVQKAKAIVDSIADKAKAA